MSRELIGSKGNIYVLQENDVLGRGAYGTVYKGIDKKTKQEVAIKAVGDVKVIKGKATKYIEIAERELNILQQITDIDEVINFIDTTKDDFEDYVYIITEYCDGGTLRQKLKKRKKGYFKEEDALDYIKQVAIGVQKLHQKNIMHRDLNLYNIFLKEGKCKIGDFGSAVKKKKADTWSGAPGHQAPEMSLVDQGGSYNNKVDIWAMGVMLFKMLYGSPAYHDIQKQLRDDDSEGIYRFPEEPEVSFEAARLLDRMLRVNPTERIDIGEIIENPVFSLDASEKMAIKRQKRVEFPPAEEKQKKAAEKAKKEEQVLEEMQGLFNYEEHKIESTEHKKKKKKKKKKVEGESDLKEEVIPVKTTTRKEPSKDNPFSKFWALGNIIAVLFIVISLLSNKGIEII